MIPGSQNVAALIDHFAATRPYQRALIRPVHQGGQTTYAHWSFRQLRARIDAYAHGFRAMGLGPGDRASVFLRPGFSFPAAVYALFKVGAAPVFIDPGMGREAALGCLKRMAPKALVAVPLLQAIRPFFASAFASVQHRVTDGGHTGYWGGTTLEALWQRHQGDGPFEGVLRDPDEEAAILFTSGSTGPAKGVRTTHRILAAQTKFIQEMYNIESGEIDVPGLPVFGLFSLAMGMSVAVPEIDASRPATLDPARLVQLIEDVGATNLFGGIAILRPVLRHCQATGQRLPSLKRVLSAGTAIPVALHRAFRGLLAEGVQIHTPYGATEALPVATLASEEVLCDTAARTLTGAGTCVGRPAPQMAIRILPISDDPISSITASSGLSAGEIGEICVSGPVVTRLYEGDEAATAAAKIRDEHGQIWHRMGDLGALDAQGRLWFCGRKAHRVQTAQGLMFSVPCEEIVNQHPAVARSALVGVGPAGAAEPVIVVEREPGSPLSDEALAAEVRALCASQPVTAPIQRVLFHPRFPVDVRHNAKIHNEALAAWAATQPGPRPRLGAADS